MTKEHAHPSLPASYVAALTKGFPPHSEPLDCEDLRGHHSLFGENVKPPRPLPAALVEDLRLNKANGIAAGFDYLWRSDLSSSEDAPSSPVSLDIAAPVHIVGKTTSTFEAARVLQERGLLPPWGAVMASCQTKGRGQTRKEWHSPRGNLYVSFRLPEAPLFRHAAASVFLGTMLAEALIRLGFPVRLKWPNDLISPDGKKVAGILLEERDGVHIAGLGVNLMERPGPSRIEADNAMPAGLLFPADEDEDPPAPFPLWRSLVHELVKAYEKGDAAEEPAAALRRTDAVMAWKGLKVVLLDEGTPLCEGTHKGIGPQGGLRIQEADGECDEHFSGSLRLL